MGEIVGMKNWDDEEECWVGVVCEVNESKTKVTVLDANKADTEVGIEAWIQHSIKTRPWEVG